MRSAGRLPLLLWPVAVAAIVAGFVLLFAGEDEVTAVAVVNRAVGGSFIVCGLIVWQRRPHNRVGALLALTGSLFLAQELLGELDSDLGYTLAEVLSNWWLASFAALILGFPTGRLATRADRLIVWGLVFGTVVWQIAWMLVRPSPPDHHNLLLIDANAHAADLIDTWQRTFNTLLGTAAGVLGLARWLRGAPPLRRLLLPTLAGSVAILILGAQSWYRILSGEFMRPTAEITAVVLVLVPLAFLIGSLRKQLARAGTAELLVALQQAPDTERLGALLAHAVGDPSLELVFWLPGFECFADGAGRPVALPVPGSGRTVTRIGGDGEPVGAIIHDAALDYDDELLGVISAAAAVALERRRLEGELESRVTELAGSRARLVAAGDEARRQLERDLHDGAQQRLVSLAIALRVMEDQVHGDPDGAAAMVAAAREEVESRVAELAGSRARLVAAGDEARRQLERDLHDGAQQRLVSLAIALRVMEDQVQGDPQGAAAMVAAAREEVAASLAELRELARGIHPAVLEHGLAVALDSLATRASTPVSVSVALDERLPAQIELAAYFVACEALTNVGKYARASRATIRVTRGDSVTLEIADDGVGGADPGRGSGLRGLVDRVEAAGGRLRVSSPPGAGTVVRADFPCEVRPVARHDSLE